MSTRVPWIVISSLVAFGAVSAATPPNRLSTMADYGRYIDPLLKVPDFGIHYYDDGAADASVLFPMTEGNPYDRPREAVIALVRLREEELSAAD